MSTLERASDLNQPDPEDVGETFGTDLAEAIEALSDLVADGYDLGDAAEPVAGCIGYLSDLLAPDDAAPADGMDSTMSMASRLVAPRRELQPDLQRVIEGTRRADPKHFLRARLLDVSFRDPSEPGNGPNWYTITGHAAVTGQETILADLGWLRIRERIAPGAFDRALASNPDVHLNINHDMKYAMARTGVQGVGGLSLTMDSVGLRTFAQVSTELSFARDLAVQMKTGIIDQMSFAFTIANETRSEVDDGETIDVLYEISEVAQLFDVCVCAQGAYSQTDSNLHSRITAALGRAGIDPAVHPSDRRAASVAVVGSRTTVEPGTAVGVSVAAHAASLRRRRQATLAAYPKRES